MRSILVVDPNPELRAFVCAVLTRAGCTVRETPDVHMAPALLRAAPADLIVTDLGKPNPRGVETLEALHREFPSLEIIPLSGAPHSAGFLRLAATLSRRRTVARPFMCRELMSLINEMMAGVAAHIAHAEYRARRAA